LRPNSGNRSLGHPGSGATCGALQTEDRMRDYVKRFRGIIHAQFV